MMMMMIIMGHECTGGWQSVGKRKGERKGYARMKKMEVCYIRTYEDTIMKPINHCLKEWGKGTREMKI
jgi:hypothetical protein